MGAMALGCLSLCNTIAIPWKGERKANQLRLQFAPSLTLCGHGHATTRPRMPSLVLAQKTDVNKAIGTVVKTAKEFVDAGIKLVPDSVPRPLAQAGVSAAGLLVALFLLKSLFSTVLFIFVIGVVSYFIFLYVSKDEGPGSGSGGGGGGSGGTNDALEEARRIMDKYK